MKLLLPFLLAFGLYAHDAKGKSHAPASAKTLKSPLTAAQAKAEFGKPLYLQHCASCHGEDGSAKTNSMPKLKKAAPVLNDHHTASLKDGEIYWVITNGVSPAMPAFKTQLTDAQRWQVVLFVRSLAGSH